MEPQLKNDGRYTAYHVYQDLSFSEANRASTIPYRSPCMKCAHSQRGYLFQFDSMPQRNHFDAANTTCCDEPVLNFGNKPQYASSSKPMSPRDCRKDVRSAGCEILEVSAEDYGSMCASDTPRLTRVKIRCPALCVEFSNMTSGETYSGKYGRFRSLGYEPGDVMILEYLPDQLLLDDIYDRCSGTVTLIETFCGGYSIEFTLNAGLNFPNGCGCDCCGQKGIFPPPALSIAAPTSIAANWGNTLDLSDPVIGDQACKGGEITGTFTGVNGVGQVSWDSQTGYVSDGVTRYVSRKPSSIGSASNSACCGGHIQWVATDGCGATKTGTTIVQPKISGAYTFSPPDNSTLSEGVIYDFSVNGACSFSDTASLTLTRQCLNNTQGPLIRENGLLKSGFTGALTLNSSPECSACCGSGSITLNFTDGCGGASQASYTVRKSLSYQASGLVTGKRFRCGLYYVPEPTPAYVYDVQIATVYCDGHVSSYSRSNWGSYSTVSECASKINSPQSPFIQSQTAISGLTDSSSCLFYSNNGQTGSALVAELFSVMDKCCEINTGDIIWINRSDVNRCCPK